MELDKSALRKNKNFIELSGEIVDCSICHREFSVESLRSFSKHLVCTGCIKMIQAICYKNEDKLD